LQVAVTGDVIRLVTCVAFALVLSIPTGVAQQATFRGTSDTVRVFVTVTDRDGRLVTTLNKDHFETLDDGKLQPITVFDNSPQPIQMIILLDISGSMHGNLTLLRRASMKLFGELGPDDVARVGTFGNQITISSEFTRDTATLEAALPDEIPESAPTPLWRAIDESMTAFDSGDRRRVILVLSDGKDSGPSRYGRHTVNQERVVEHARLADVVVYAVGLQSRGPSRRAYFGPGGGLVITNISDEPDPELARTAEATGGGYAEVRPHDDLGAAFAAIARELHSQYLLGYEPPKRDGKVHKIEVRVLQNGLEPRARKSYLAPNGK
jgi:VWFA-related protein